MRPLREYTAADWRRLRPLLHSVKSWRYQAIRAAFVRRPARVGNAAQVARAMTGRQVLVTVAFGDADLIDWQSQLIARFVPDAYYVIADNSVDDAAAARIAGLSRERGIPYVRMPENTWRRGVSSRSHGLALNWIWHNLILPGRPRDFGFIDHDLFPMQPGNPFAPLDHQDFYGLVRVAGSRWFLWAGFCMYRFQRVADLPLDFGQDWFNGLDTGGGNWRVLYQQAHREELAEAPSHYFPYKEGVSGDEARMQWCGTWLHEVGTGVDSALRRDKRRVLHDRLEPYLEHAPSPSPAAATQFVAARLHGPAG